MNNLLSRPLLMNTRRLLGVLALLAAWQAPVQAQLPDPRPSLRPIQGLLADESEFRRGDLLVSVGFGAQIAGQRQTTLIQEDGYPDGGFDQPSRVAIFTKNASGEWLRSGSIDPPSGQTRFGTHMALFNELALFEASQGQMAFLYRRSSGKWKLIQKLTAPSGFHFTDVRLSSGWAFIGALSATNPGAVYVYQVTSTGTLKGVQTLRSFSGNPRDRFGEHVAVFGERVVVSAGGDSDNRGAAYVFERSGALFAKKQKLIAINGAANHGFGTAIGISEDWIAVGAPFVQGPDNGFCPGQNITGAVYTFRRINGVWLQQETLLAEGAQDRSRECISNLGEGLVIADKWIVTTVRFAIEAGDTIVPLVYVRDAGHYAPLTWPLGFDAPLLALNLVDSTLFLGASVERGCGFEGCIGAAQVYDLSDALP